MAEFLTGNFISEHGQLLRQLVLRLEYEYEDLPKEYSVFLSDIGKYTRVSGYLQCTGPESLQALQVYSIINIIV